MRHIFPALLALILALFIAITASAADKPDKDGKAKKRKTPPHLVETVAVVTQSRAIERVELGTLKHRRTVRIFNQEEGRITEAPWFEADLVKQEDVLVRLDAALIQAEMDKARAESRQAALDVRRLSKLSKQRLSSEDELANARTALNVARAEEKVLNTRLGYMTIHAPFSGVITERLVEPGDAVSKHTHLFTLADPASLVTEIRVSELMLPYLQVGDSVQIRIDALGAKTFEGRIHRIHPEIEVSTRRGVVEAELNPVPKGARAGQFSRITLRSRGVERQLIPFASVRRDRLGEYVFRVEKGSKVQRADIVTGLRFGNEVEVLQGLKNGQNIVLRGFLGLRDGKKVKLANSKAKAQETVEKTDKPKPVIKQDKKNAS